MIKTFSLEITLLCLISFKAIGLPFMVIDDTIIDPQGDPFIAKGVNIFADRNEDYHAIVNCWGFNAIRVAHFPDNHWYNPTWEFDLLVNDFANKNIVVIFNLAMDSQHKGLGIGSYWPGYWSELVHLYSHFALRYKDNPYVWFETSNEPGTTESLTANPITEATTWLNLNKTLIQAIRETGNINPILVQGWCWGQDACDWSSSLVSNNKSALLSQSDPLLSSNVDPLNNLIFSQHVYEQWNHTRQNKLYHFQHAILDANKALIVTEYGSENASTPTLKATNAMFDSAQKLGIGRFVWHWGADDNNDLTLSEKGHGGAINHCKHPTNLTPLGKKVWNDNHSNSMIPAIIAK
ncbi:cellulase family glycosylhydrolase [Shewanella surugensis]|uniref:Glycoside hydrolase family 5 protein n=1 Tax=Shewanella surugensis TaxID=212020 RepID=A0ABT0LBG9_9GAMM|nr:cellulase family glycosylhydrolase [Shewanella surugensis]MCL1125036.1 glycoside hydrolase family 5 protein [Shewanella surugensis]